MQFNIRGNLKWYRNPTIELNSFESERVFQEIKSKLDSSDKIKFFENIKLKNIEEDEIDLGIEDLTKIRKHKSIERCPKIIRQVKNVLGYICQVCLINLEEKYGAIGKEYIEAHHLKPVHLNKGTQQKRNVSDFAVLCPNCHRMIHRSDHISDLEGFKNLYHKKNK